MRLLCPNKSSKVLLQFTIGCLMLPGSAIIAQHLPEPARIGQGAYISGELIYSLDNRPTPQCHASTIEEIDDGFIAAWFGGTHEKNIDVGIWTSRNINGTWASPTEVADGVKSDTLRYPCWNPVLFQPTEGPLMLFYKVGPSPSEWWGMLVTSEDDGQTWSRPRKLGRSRHGHLLGPIKNKPVQLQDGTIICPTSIEYENEKGEDFWRVYFEISKDLGQTWEVTEFVNDGIEFDAIQPSILFHLNNLPPGPPEVVRPASTEAFRERLSYSAEALGDSSRAGRQGKLQILCRTQQGVIAQSWSEDHGKTWNVMTATSLPNPNAGTDAVTLMDGRQLVVYNHTTRAGSFPKGRNMLNIAISKDGISWNPVLTLERKEGEYSYPAVIQASDGSVHITYTYLRQSIKHVVVDPAQFN